MPSFNPKMKKIVEKMGTLDTVVEDVLREFIVSYEYFKSSVDETLKRYYLDQ